MGELTLRVVIMIKKMVGTIAIKQKQKAVQPTSLKKKLEKIPLAVRSVLKVKPAGTPVFLAAKPVIKPLAAPVMAKN